MAKALRLTLLGKLRIAYDDIPVSGFVSSKAEALLCYLAVTGRAHFRQSLIGLLWGDMPETEAKANLRVVLSNLRRLVGPHLSITRQTVGFNAESAYWLDVEAFLAELAPSAAETHVDRLRAAVNLYRGDFLDGFYLREAPAFEEWVLAQRERFRGLALNALHTLAIDFANQGESGHAAAIGYTTHLLALDPWREEAHRQLMLLLARSGQYSAALAQFETCRRMLAEELAVEPSQETTALYERIRAASARPRRPLHLPSQATPFVGREAELAAIRSRLANPACRLLTLVGPGGVGKTRLAVQAAGEQRHRFFEGVYVAPLAPITSASLLVPTIANALELSFFGAEDPKIQLLNYLRHKEMLLVLDNFEHLADEGTDLIAEICRSSPEIKLLVTSRVRLNLHSEWLLEIRGLTFPEGEEDGRTGRPETTPGEATAPELERYSAVELFLQSVRRTQAGFSPGPEDLAAVVRICRLVDGLPLGIELAAAWVRSLSCQEIEREIERSLSFLATTWRDVPERHRSLRAVFDHSWRLLSEAERDVFRKLAVFRGGFRREAAAQVAGASLPVLSALVDKSFLRLDGDGRYERHVLLWQYSQEKLRQVPKERLQAEMRHSQYYAAFLAQRAGALAGEQQEQSLTEIVADIENVRAAWQWAVEHEQVKTIGQALEGLYLTYDLRSWFQEGEAMFGQAAAALASAGNPGHPPGGPQALTRGKVMARQGWFAYRLGHYEAARRLLRQSLGDFRQLDERVEMANALNHLGNVALYLGEFDEAQKLYEESLATKRAINDRRGMASSLTNLGNVAYSLGKLEEAQQLHEQSLALYREFGDQHGMALSLNNLGNVVNARGQHETAKQLLQEGLQCSQQIGDQFVMALSLINLGSVDYYLKVFPAARARFQESLKICTGIGDRRGVALSYQHLGLVAEEMGQFWEARQQYHESLAIFKEIGDRRGAVISLVGLGNAACKLGRAPYSDAEQHYLEALQTAAGIQATPLVLGGLFGVARLRRARGELEPALELTALVLHHSAIDPEDREKAKQLQAELVSELPPESVAAAQRRGRDRKLEDAVAGILGNARAAD